MIINGFRVSIRKTEKIDVNDAAHPLPPDLGEFQEYRVSEYNCPKEWSNDGIFIPVKEGDPLWIDFRGNDECACLPSIQRLNPVTGLPSNLKAGLRKDPQQNYLALPNQMWLDGYVKDGKVYQFVVTRAGIGLAVNEFVLPKDMQDSHAMGFAFFRPKVKKTTTPPTMTLQTIQYPLDPRCWEPSLQSPVWMVPPNIWTSDSVLRSAGVVGKSAIASSEPNASPGVNLFYSSSNNVGDKPTLPQNVQSKSSPEVIDILRRKQEAAFAKASMGAGGRIHQTIVQDENTVKYYQKKNPTMATIYMALPEMFESIMEKGKRQDSRRKDKYVFSGEIGGVQVPLIK